MQDIRAEREECDAGVVRPRKIPAVCGLRFKLYVTVSENHAIDVTR